VKDWILLIGTLIEGLTLSTIAAYYGGSLCFMVACLISGWCLTQRDSGYQHAVMAGNGRVLTARYMYFAEHGVFPTKE